MIENKSPSCPISGYEPSIFKQTERSHASFISAHVGSRSPTSGSPRPMSPPSSPGSSPPRSSSKSDTPSSSLPPSFYPSHHAFPPQTGLIPNLSSPFSRPSDFLLGSSMTDLHYNRHQSLQMVSPNDPTANACKIVDFHGEKIASFTIHGKTMLCLPQAFEFFLKNLVGGLHTVYTKCKRLGINPIVCNVEQVRVLRGLGSIQPGVNRCKLIADTDFDELMRDCNTSRPGRPPKRMAPITTFANMPSPDPSFLGAISTSLQGGIPFPPPQPPHHPRDLTPGFNPFLPLAGSPQAAQMAQHAQAQAALLSRNGLLPGSAASPELMLEKYGHMLRQLQGLQKDERRGSSSPASPLASPQPALNLSYKSEDEKQDDISDKSESELADIEDENDTMDDAGSDDNSLEGANVRKLGENGFGKKMPENGVGSSGPAGNSNMLQFWQNIQGHIQDLVKTAITNAKDDEETKSEGSNRDDVEKQLGVEKDSLGTLRKQIEEAQKQSELYLRRFKKEKRLRRKIQNQLEIESFKKAKLEEALSTLSYKTFLQVKDLRDNESNDKENLA